MVPEQKNEMEKSTRRNTPQENCLCGSNGSGNLLNSGTKDSNFSSKLLVQTQNTVRSIDQEIICLLLPNVMKESFFEFMFYIIK